MSIQNYLMRIVVIIAVGFFILASCSKDEEGLTENPAEITVTIDRDTVFKGETAVLTATYAGLNEVDYQWQAQLESNWENLLVEGNNEQNINVSYDDLLAMLENGQIQLGDPIALRVVVNIGQDNEVVSNVVSLNLVIQLLNYQNFGEHNYALIETSTTWEVAKLIAEKKEGYLVIIKV